jgi:hypothetical protein
MMSHIRPRYRAADEKENTYVMRRKTSAANWRFPRRATYTQWRRLPYRTRWWYIAEAQCNLLGYWRDCAKKTCRRARRCQHPQPCYWDRKSQLSEQQRRDMDKKCAPLRALLGIGFSRKGSHGLSLF